MRAETVRRGSSQGVSSRSCDNCVVTDCQVLRCSLPFYEARAFLQKPTRIDVGLCQDHIGQFDRGDECVYDYDQNVVLFGGDVAALGPVVSSWTLKTVWRRTESGPSPSVQLELCTETDEATFLLPLTLAPGFLQALNRRLDQDPPGSA